MQKKYSSFYKSFIRGTFIKTVVFFTLSIMAITSTVNAATIPVIADEIVTEKQEIIGVINKNNVNFYIKPSVSSNIVQTIPENTKVKVLSIFDIWCKIEYNEIKGYILANYVSANGTPLRFPQGTITASVLNVRSGPSTKHNIITTVSAGTEVDLLEKVDNWYHIRYNNTEGYVNESYVRRYYGNIPSVIGEKIVKLSMNYLDVRYVWGGLSPKGFDCSGFTLYLFKQFGYDLPHSASSQWHNCGEYIERKDLQPGDLVMFNDPARNNGKACSHVGIYIGNDQFIHASSGSKRVCINNLNETYFNKYYKGAKRIGMITE